MAVPRIAMPLAGVALAMVLHAQAGVAQGAGGWRRVEIATTEVTAPDMAVAPNGEWLVFSMLGHLFQLSVAGGEATQLTFGPSYDCRPAVSPDSSRIAFQSDRDGSEGNIFLLDLSDRETTQVTHATFADAPSWSPDGRSLVCLQRQWQGWSTVATVWRAGIGGGSSEELRAEAGEVLRAATSNAAEAVGAASELGAIEPGKVADIVILDRNPLEDIRNTQAIWRVIKDGAVLDPAELRAAGN